MVEVGADLFAIRRIMQERTLQLSPWNSKKARLDQEINSLVESLTGRSIGATEQEYTHLLDLGSPPPPSLPFSST
jgi:hypothetical protein